VETGARDEIHCRGAAEECIRIRGAFQRLGGKGFAGFEFVHVH
jgi:hypothetical protein